eukprot:TRINITY_DN2719_c0_g3_i1.p1 TRINITY_DN2719_c0_g3~~TRINITY_DN2719_c0_g3_i1.p1  ORF type:complete len:2018 (+),score=609.16 TRINITY_DN2719_c0_g3_i1:764-6055(+)
MSSAASLQQAEQVLAPHSQAMIDIQRKLAESQRGQPAEVARSFATLANQLRMTQQTLTQNLGKYRSAKTQAEQQQKSAEAEQRDNQAWQDMLPEMTTKIQATEEAVEKALATFESIAAAEDDMTQAQNAVQETEAAAKAAEQTVAEARMLISSKQNVAKQSFQSAKVQQQAGQEFGQLLAKIQAAQNKLMPLRNVRQDLQQRQMAQQIVKEVSESLTPAEQECEAAGQAAAQVPATGATQEQIQGSEHAYMKANDALNAVKRLVNQKKMGATPVTKEKLGVLEERIKKADEKLQKIQQGQKEAAEGVALQSLLQESQEKLQAVKDAVAKAHDAEAPFIMGVEVPLDRTLSAVKACETLATSSSTSASIARMFLGTKMLEAKQFTPSLSAKALEKIKEFQAELDGLVKRLTDLKAKTAERKKGALVKEVSIVIKEAEDLSAKVTEAASVFADDSKLASLSQDEVKTAADATEQAEQLASAAIVEARKSLRARQDEARAKEGYGGPSALSQDLSALQTRLNDAEREVNKQMRSCQNLDQRIRAQKRGEEALTKMAALEELADKSTELVAKIAEDTQAPDSSVKDADDAVFELSKEIRNSQRNVDYQSRSREDAVREAATKLQDRLTAVQEKLDKAHASLRLRGERVAVKDVLDECRKYIQDTEAAVKTSSAAEAAFLKSTPLNSEGKDGQDGAGAEGATLLAELEAAIKAANSAVRTATAELGVKRVSLKRIPPELTSTAMAELDELQKRLDEESQKLASSKKIVADRQNEVVKKDMAEKLIIVQKLFEASKAATAKLEAQAAQDDVSADALATGCRMASIDQRAASDALVELQNILGNRQKEISRSSRDQADTSTLGEIANQLQQCDDIQKDLESQRVQLRDHHDKSAAKRLLKDCVGLVEKLEKQMQGCDKAGLFLNRAENELAGAVYLTYVIEAIQESMQRTSETAEAIADKLVGEASEKVSLEKWLAFLKDLPELQAVEGVPLYSPEELKLAYLCLIAPVEVPGETPTEAAKADLLDKFKARYIVTNAIAMTDRLAMRGGRIAGRLALNDVVQALEPAGKDEVSGLARIKVRAEKDGKEGYVTISTINGKKFLETFSGTSMAIQQVEEAVNGMSDALVSTAKTLDGKLQGVSHRKSGPLADVKAEVSKLRPQIATVQMNLNALKKKVASGKKLLSDTDWSERSRKQEAIDKATASKIQGSTEKAWAAMQTQLAEVFPKAEPLAEAMPVGPVDGERSVDDLLASEQALLTLSEAFVEMQRNIADNLDTVRYAAAGPLAQAASAISSIAASVDEQDEKCKKLLASIQAQRKRLATEARVAVADALRAAAKKESLGAEALFDKLRKDSPTIPVQELNSFLAPHLKAGELKLGLERYEASGFTKLCLCSAVQDYMKCVKDIAMTPELDIKAGQSTRRLAIGEFCEVVEPAAVDEGSSMSRVKCRPLVDLSEGFVSVKASTGSPFLERCAKPFYCCREELLVQAAFESSSSEVKRLRPGQVVEVLEGPRRETASECIRVKGRSVKDGKIGFVTGTDSLELLKVFVCRQTTALTSEFDITKSKSLRKLEPGELLDILEEAKDDEKRSLSRVRVRTRKDDKEGWATMKGNQGTSFVEESTSHHLVKAPLQLEGAFRSGSAFIRQLEEGEIFETLDAPKTEKKEGDQRMRGTDGWFTFGKFLTLWSPKYRCLRATDLTESLDAASTVSRKIVQGELVEALELPRVDEASGLVRVQVRTEKDNSLGFATVQESQGPAFLEALSPERPSER